MQASFEQRGLFDFLFVGVAVPEVGGVDADDIDGLGVIMSVDDC